MADVEDHDHVAIDAIEDSIRKWRHPKGAYRRSARRPAFKRRRGEAGDALDDQTNHPLRRCGVPRFQIVEDRLAVGERPRRVTDFHPPWRWSALARTSSGTNSPRSASPIAI